jgi:2-oxoglutarate ferredoxin oxidoreductase subunit alpha
MQRQRRSGRKLAWIHLTNINPLPHDLGEKLARFDKVIVPELNSGQLCRVIRAKYLIDALSVGKVAGLPFTAREIEAAIEGVRS